MKKLLFCILLSFSIFSQSYKYSNGTELTTALKVVKTILSWGFGDGMMEYCVKEWLKCDEYEDVTLTDQLTGIFSSKKKVQVCAANSIVKNLFRVAGAMNPFYNMLGNMAQCFQAYLQKNSALKKAESYRICLDTQDDGHPLPLTDKQIAKILKRTGQFATVENIVDKYNKLCVQKGADLSTAKFYKEGDTFDSIYVGHATGYAYVLCASVFSACPCIYNIQRGQLDDPKYVKDKETDIVKMRSNGTMMVAKIPTANTTQDDDESFNGNEVWFNKHYAKHCRLVRYKEAYEQQNDLATIFDESCFDLHGYSKYNANITAGIVQCIENTARNIFEKPIMSVEVQNVADSNALDWYTKDYDLMYKSYVKIKQLLGGNETYEKAVKSTIPIKKSERREILSEFVKILHQTETFKVEYECDNTKAVSISYSTSMYDKYIKNPSKKTTKYCCEADTKLNNRLTCFDDIYVAENSELASNITVDQEDISLADIYVEKENLENMMSHIKDLKVKASKATSTIMNTKSSKGFGMTLFDILRNRLKVIATLALVLWVFLLGWKLVFGDSGSIDAKSFGLMALKVFICYMVVFSETAKNYIFNLAIQTSQGVGMALNKTMEGFRSQRDNKYNRNCNFTSSNYYEEPSIQIIDKYGKETGNLYVVKAGGKNGDNGEITKIKRYSCNSWEKEVVKKDEFGIEHHYCEEFKMECNTGDFTKLKCIEYYKNYENKEDKKHCRVGNCYTQNESRSVVGTSKSTNVLRNADEYEEVKFNYCNLAKKEDGTSYDVVQYIGCSAYKTFFGNQVCVEHSCKNIIYYCNPNYGLKKECAQKGITSDGTLSGCLSYTCKKEADPFIAMPPMERPYKAVSYYAKDTTTGMMMMKYFTPKCHKDNIVEDRIVYDNETDPNAVLQYSASLNDYVYMCPDKPEYADYVLDDGFRISEYIEHGIIENSDNGILVFQSLLPERYQEKSNAEKRMALYNYPVRTAVATMDINGFVEEYNFIDSGRATEGFQRAKYRTYLRSMVVSKNKNSDYPKIKKYGATRNYSHLSFWDSMDCKIIQFISLQGYGDGFNDSLGDAVSGVNNGNSDQLVTSALNGMLQFFKFIFMCWPFGILAFMLMFALGAMLFMLVARAAQQYCICVFNLVLIVYLSPFVFVLYLFEQTEGALNTWLDDLKANIAGACVPFVSISIFLFIIDYVLFGDSNHYVDGNLFNPDGSINPDCYEDRTSEAPVACLSKKLLKRFSIWQNILYLLTGNWNGIFKGETYVMAFWLVLRCLFGAALIAALTKVLDKIEEEIYKITGKPDTKIGSGFEQSASDSIKSGAKSSLTAGKFAQATFAAPFKVAVALIALIPGVGKAINSIKKKYKEFKKQVKNKLKETKDKIFGNSALDASKNNIRNITNQTNQILQNTINNYKNQINNQKDQLLRQQDSIQKQIESIQRTSNLSDIDKMSKISDLKSQLAAEKARIEERIQNLQSQRQSAIENIKQLGEQRARLYTNENIFTENQNNDLMNEYKNNVGKQIITNEEIINEV